MKIHDRNRLNRSILLHYSNFHSLYFFFVDDSRDLAWFCLPFNTFFFAFILILAWKIFKYDFFSRLILCFFFEFVQIHFTLDFIFLSSSKLSSHFFSSLHQKEKNIHHNNDNDCSFFGGKINYRKTVCNAFTIKGKYWMKWEYEEITAFYQPSATTAWRKKIHWNCSIFTRKCSMSFALKIFISSSLICLLTLHLCLSRCWCVIRIMREREWVSSVCNVDIICRHIFSNSSSTHCCFYKEPDSTTSMWI